jgi:hypothetical protein
MQVLMICVYSQSPTQSKPQKQCSFFCACITPPVQSCIKKSSYQTNTKESTVMNRVMQRMKSNPVHMIFAMSTLFTALCVAPSACAQQGPPAQQRPTQPAVSASATPAPVEASVQKDSGLQQGIQMHGLWVINVRNPDGKLVEHREFENSLQSSGQGILLGLLSGYLTPGDFAIDLLGASGSSGACSQAGSTRCEIVRSTATVPGSFDCSSNYCGTGLTVTPNFGTTFGGPYSLVLSGSITANNTGVITQVYTEMNTCANSYSSANGITSPASTATASPAACVTSVSTGTTTTQSQFFFSGTTIVTSGTNIPAPVSITNGQIIQVIVTLSFS